MNFAQSVIQKTIERKGKKEKNKSKRVTGRRRKKDQREIEGYKWKKL